MVRIRELAASLVLTAIPFCLRANNSLIASFESSATTPLFAGALIVGIALACAVLFSKALDKSAPTWRAAAFLCVLAGLACTVASPELPGLDPVAASVAGALLGFGLTVCVFAWCSLIASHTPGSIVLNVSLSLFAVSLISYALALIESAAILCGILALFCIASFAATAKQPPHGQSNRLTSFPLTPLTTSKRIVWFGWAGLFGIAFNFFTLGLTFWPAAAGLASEGPSSSKPVAYALVLIAALLAVHRARATEEGFLDLFYRTALPVAGAIVLASPFLETAVSIDGIPLVSSIPYLGIALLNALGIVVVVWIGAFSRSSLATAFAVMAACCAAAMGAGMLVFQALGHQAQVVSLCILALFLAVMVFATIRDGMQRQSQESQSAHEHLESVCAQIAETYALSPRETEILEYLARGRGSKYIADKLCISSETVRTHSKRIYDKMDVHTKEELLDRIEEKS